MGDHLRRLIVDGARLAWPYVLASVALAVLGSTARRSALTRSALLFAARRLLTISAALAALADAAPAATDTEDPTTPTDDAADDPAGMEAGLRSVGDRPPLLLTSGLAAHPVTGPPAALPFPHLADSDVTPAGAQRRSLPTFPISRWCPRGPPTPWGSTSSAPASGPA